MTDEIWTTQDGRQIPVGEMAEEHVRNVLRMILKKRRRKQAMYEKLKDVVRRVMAEDQLREWEMQEKLHNSIMDDLAQDAIWGKD